MLQIFFDFYLHFMLKILVCVDIKLLDLCYNIHTEIWK